MSIFCFNDSIFWSAAAKPPLWMRKPCFRTPYFGKLDTAHHVPPLSVRAFIVVPAKAGTQYGFLVRHAFLLAPHLRGNDNKGEKAHSSRYAPLFPLVPKLRLRSRARDIRGNALVPEALLHLKRKLDQAKQGTSEDVPAPLFSQPHAP